jgi:tripartite-type tricarboxylate transporter receptor subunit TctC
MSIPRRALVLLFSLISAAALLPLNVSAAGYPDRPLKMIVPFNAGGNVDAVARLVGARMAQTLGQPVIVDNRAGAGGSLGAEVVAHSAPDGYTLLAGSNGPLTINPFLQAKLRYDPLKDLAPITLAGFVPHVMLVNNALPAKTVQELVELSKKQAVSVATSGIGSATHLTLERFKFQSGARLEHIPYRGGNSPISDLLGGSLHAAMMELSTALPLHRGGKVRILAVAAAGRSKLAPDVATFIESGVKDFTAASYVGFLAPAGTQTAVVERLQKSITESLSVPSVNDTLRGLGIESATVDQQTPAGFAAFLRTEFERSREAARLAGLKPE